MTIRQLEGDNEFSTFSPPDMKARVATVVDAARAAADSVDREARFPREAFDAARTQRLLGLLLPREIGGEDATVSEVAQICYALGRVCSSTAMIYAMHQVSLACLARHRDEGSDFAGYLRRIGERQMLIASSTTEGQNGANLRSSVAPIEWNGTQVSLQRNATVVSYGRNADAIISTARRSPDSVATDQVLALFFKEDYCLETTAGWEALGMRGTCSEGFRLNATGERSQVLGEPYERIHRRTMLPATHLLWTAVWTGVAAGAVERAQMFVRKAARAAKGDLPPGAPYVTQANMSLLTLRNLVASSLSSFERSAEDAGALETVEFQTSMNLLKVSASELSIATVMFALQACGLSGYRSNGEFSVARQLRDVLSSSIMINNNRILSNVASASLLGGVPETLN